MSQAQQVEEEDFQLVLMSQAAVKLRYEKLSADFKNHDFVVVAKVDCGEIVNTEDFQLHISRQIGRL